MSDKGEWKRWAAELPPLDEIVEAAWSDAGRDAPMQGTRCKRGCCFYGDSGHDLGQQMDAPVWWRKRK